MDTLLKCAECGNPAGQKCGRCQQVVYCNRECQVKHWPSHKGVCNDPRAEEKKYAVWMLMACARISGNVRIMASHRYANVGLGVVFAEIDETIEEFMKGGSMHFAHLSFASADEYREYSRTKYNLELTSPVPELVFTDIVVVFVLKNYHVVMVHPTSDAAEFAALKKNYPDPDNDWSVLFTM